MAKGAWVNLPVKDVGKSKEFFGKLGFSFDEKRSSDEMAVLWVGESKSHVLLFSEKTFKSFTRNELPNTGKATEVLISFDAESREEVDQMARRVFEAGGTIFGEPGEIQGWMYGCGFADLDGHRWNVLYMDFSKMPEQ
jgi:predicted lactoylglutathione lyase